MTLNAVWFSIHPTFDTTQTQDLMQVLCFLGIQLGGLLMLFVQMSSVHYPRLWGNARALVVFATFCWVWLAGFWCLPMLVFAAFAQQRLMSRTKAQGVDNPLLMSLQRKLVSLLSVAFVLVFAVGPSFPLAILLGIGLLPAMSFYLIIQAKQLDTHPHQKAMPLFGMMALLTMAYVLVWPLEAWLPAGLVASQIFLIISAGLLFLVGLGLWWLTPKTAPTA
jgi:hypothetical protein